ncbi:MAG: lysophospholipase L1-like esterase [Bacillariaceae sp.]|jgi:lysophospholipase L1-like esterase
MYIRKPIVLFGDSITQYAYGEEPSKIGWASLLSGSYQRRADVLNRGFSGYNTRHALDLVPKLFPKNNDDDDSSTSTYLLPLFCTIFFGANDAALPSTPTNSDSGRQHVPKKEYKKNLEKIVLSIRERTGTKSSDDLLIIIITPPPVDEETWKNKLGLYDHYDRSNLITRDYGEVAKMVGSSLNCPVLDTWELLCGNDLDVYKSHLSDGLHLSDSGNQLVYEGLMQIIKGKFPNLAPVEPTDDDDDNSGTGGIKGIQVEEALWTDLC